MLTSLHSAFRLDSLFIRTVTWPGMSFILPSLSLLGKGRIRPAGAWYIQVGQGMAATLNVASEKGAYTLTDRGPYPAHQKRVALDIVFALLVAAVLMSGGHAEGQAPAKRDVIVALTTSTQDSGLMDVLVPMFEKQSGHRVKTIAAGTGQTLTMGVRGDADVVLGHAPELERKYVAEGAFINRRLFMYNDFVVVGPPSDPLKIRGMQRLAETFRRIAEGRGRFVSRGDQSGTHIRELALWDKAKIKPSGEWYIQTGQGQGATLNVASEKRAYALTDRGTFLALQRRLALEILFEGARPLLNIYHAMEINPARHPKVNHAGGKAFADFLMSPAAQKLIATFGVEKFGQPLFFAAAGKQEAEFDRGDH